MGKIHNNPNVIKRMGGPRMPLMLTGGIENQWLDNTIDEITIKAIVNQEKDLSLNYHTVAPLLGNNGSGNSPAAAEKHQWELEGLP